MWIQEVRLLEATEQFDWLQTYSECPPSLLLQLIASKKKTIAAVKNQGFIKDCEWHVDAMKAVYLDAARSGLALRPQADCVKSDPPAAADTVVTGAEANCVKSDPPVAAPVDREEPTKSENSSSTLDCNEPDMAVDPATVAVAPINRPARNILSPGCSEDIAKTDVDLFSAITKFVVCLTSNPTPRRLDLGREFAWLQKTWWPPPDNLGSYQPDTSSDNGKQHGNNYDTCPTTTTITTTTTTTTTTV